MFSIIFNNVKYIQITAQMKENRAEHSIIKSVLSRVLSVCLTGCLVSQFLSWLNSFLPSTFFFLMVLRVESRASEC